MAKKVWISIPLMTASEANDAAVVSFLKGGQKKELEVATARFITEWLSDKNIPFGIDFERSSLDRNLVTPSSSDADNGSIIVNQEATEAGNPEEARAGDGQAIVTAVEQRAEPMVVPAESAESVGEPAAVTATGPDSHVDASDGAAIRRARSKAARRVPEASKAEE
jgi:hypothetical protein